VASIHESGSDPVVPVPKWALCLSFHPQHPSPIEKGATRRRRRQMCIHETHSREKTPKMGIVQNDANHAQMCIHHSRSLSNIRTRRRPNTALLNRPSIAYHMHRGAEHTKVQHTTRAEHTGKECEHRKQRTHMDETSGASGHVRRDSSTAKTGSNNLQPERED
jgi:hypothetical protein